jgi:hypothetical protein
MLRGGACPKSTLAVWISAKMMTPLEKEAQLQMLRLLAQQERSTTIYIDDEEFTLSDVGRRCEAYVSSPPYGELDCSSPAGIVGRRCEVYIYSWPDGEISCRGSELRGIQRGCSVRMHNEQYGEISC